MDDSEIIKRLRLHDPEAMDYLYTHHYQRLFGVIYRYLGSSISDVEDMTHEAIIRIYEKIQLYREGPNHTFRSWTGRIAHNMCLDEIRRRSNRHTEVIPLTDYHSSALPGKDDIEGVYEYTEALGIALESINSLSSKQRITMETQLLYGDMAEGAAALGINSQTYKVRLWRARQILSERRQNSGEVT